MGTGRAGAGRARAHAKKKQYKRGHATKNRARDVDQIQDDLRVEKATGKHMTFELDEDLPGCVHCRAVSCCDVGLLTGAMVGMCW